MWACRRDSVSAMQPGVHIWAGVGYMCLLLTRFLFGAKEVADVTHGMAADVEVGKLIL